MKEKFRKIVELDQPENLDLGGRLIGKIFVSCCNGELNRIFVTDVTGKYLKNITQHYFKETLFEKN
jgi:hypothetical protein